jgi:hypothetical protein
MKEWAKGYFRNLIKCVPPNMGLGDTLKIGMIFYDRNGKPSEIHSLAEVHKNEL